MPLLPYPGTPGGTNATGSVYDVFNQLSQEAMKRRQMELANEWYGPTQKANAMSKSAYAQFALPNAIATFMQTPGAGMLTKEQQNQLANLFQQSTANAFSNQTTIPQPQQEGGGDF